PEAALVPVVAAPRFVGDVFDGERLVRRQREVLQRPRAASLDGGLEDRVELLLRNDEVFAEGVEPVDEGAFAGQLAVELFGQRLEVRLSVVRRDRVIDSLRLLVELQLLPFDYVDPRD